MKSERRQSANVPRSNSAVRFLIGIGAGIVCGWLGTLFRRGSSRATEAIAVPDERQKFSDEHNLTQLEHTRESHFSASNVAPSSQLRQASDNEVQTASDVPTTHPVSVEANVTSLASQANIHLQQINIDDANAEIGSAEEPLKTSDDDEFTSERFKQTIPLEGDVVQAGAAFTTALKPRPQHIIQITLDDNPISPSRPQETGVSNESERHSQLDMALSHTEETCQSVSLLENLPSPTTDRFNDSSEIRALGQSTIEPQTQMDSDSSKPSLPVGQHVTDIAEPEPHLRTNDSDSSSSILERTDRQPSAYRERVVESTEQFIALHADELPTNYLEWNRRITEYVIASAPRDGDAFLSITPTILARIFASFSDGSMSPAEAEADFVTAVESAYAVITTQDGRLRTLRRLDAQGQPLCVAFLAASVLAAFRMHSDEDASGGAYYFRLAGILACDMAGGSPQGFDPVVFESLWIFLQKWFADKTGVSLAMPGTEVGVRRFVALPLMHVPLRRLDIERLPSFFVWAGYSTGVKVSENKLLYDLERWTRSYSGFSSAGLSALADERRSAIASQVAQELAAWDGSSTESNGRRIASVELMLDILRYRPDISYLPRRPMGFPQHFDDGAHVFNATDDGWYEHIPVPPDAGPELSNGFEWRSQENYSFRRPPSAVVPLAAHPDYSFFVSRSNLLRGACCAVLIQDGLASAAAGYLSQITNSACSPISHPNIPLGWKLFANIRPQRRADIPEGLDALEIDAQVNIMFSGGLRAGRRREWIAGAPPRIVVTGLEEGELVRLDGHIASLSQDGFLQRNGHSLETGIHLVEAGGQRTTFEIVEPRIDSLSSFRLEPKRYVTLPQGQWTLIGAEPGETSGLISSGRQGVIRTLHFDPIWAVSVGAGPGAVVVSLKVPPPPPHPAARLESKRGVAVQRWVNLVYDASIRRPDVSSLFPTESGDHIMSTWAAYVRVAKQIKRGWRNSR